MRCKQFFPHDWYFSRGFDAEADLISADFQNGDCNTLVDDYAFFGFAAENEHGGPPDLLLTLSGALADHAATAHGARSRLNKN
jgi:hypothetical protein